MHTRLPTSWCTLPKLYSNFLGGKCVRSCSTQVWKNWINSQGTEVGRPIHPKNRFGCKSCTRARFTRKQLTLHNWNPNCASSCTQVGLPWTTVLAAYLHMYGQIRELGRILRSGFIEAIFVLSICGACSHFVRSEFNNTGSKRRLDETGS